ncbi:hypothetical protein AX17_006042 [Amanita inopinata Kibby_2008]|nr:hypothetical protein AX17_006042 [Amanita inopinata Kibby_2008]
MYHRPAVDLDLDHDASDPLNPTVNYTHFHPSAEQQDPHVPLGFKIYGLGCLLAFLIFLSLAVVYIIFKKGIRRHCKQRSEKGKETLRYLKKPSLPNSVDFDAPGHKGDQSEAEEEYDAEKQATHSHSSPSYTSASADGENIRWRGKTRDVGSWDSAATAVNDDPPRIPPFSHPPVNNGFSPINTYTIPSSPVIYAPTPLTPSVPAFARLHSPVSPKTTHMPNYMSPTEPLKAITIEREHRVAQSPQRGSVLGFNHPINAAKKGDVSPNEGKAALLVDVSTNSASSPKGILKTSPTYIARKSSVSQAYPSLGSGSSPSSHTSSPVRRDPAPDKQTQVDHSDTLHSPSSNSLSEEGPHNRLFIPPSRPISPPVGKFSPPIPGRRKWQKSKEAKVVEKGIKTTAPARRCNSSVSKCSPVAIPVASGLPKFPPLNQDTYIIHLGPDSKQDSGSSGLPARRVSISVPSNSGNVSTSRAGSKSLRSHSTSLAPTQVNSNDSVLHCPSDNWIDDGTCHRFLPPVSGRRKKAIKPDVA